MVERGLRVLTFCSMAMAGGMPSISSTSGFDILPRNCLAYEDRLSAKVGLLSGGQRQAVTLLMATLKKPKILLLDEHTAALDPKTAAKVLQITNKLVTENNLTTLMITHNMHDAITYGNRLIMMHEGQIVVDVCGEEKKNLTIEQLLGLFERASGSKIADDKVLLSK